jgi:hypothetical protein
VNFEVKKHILDERIVPLRTECRLQYGIHIESFYLENDLVDCSCTVASKIKTNLVVYIATDFFGESNMFVSLQ